jgi:hypothetical protein
MVMINKMRFLSTLFIASVFVQTITLVASQPGDEAQSDPPSKDVDDSASDVPTQSPTSPGGEVNVGSDIPTVGEGSDAPTPEGTSNDEENVPTSPPMEGDMTDEPTTMDDDEDTMDSPTSSPSNATRDVDTSSAVSIQTYIASMSVVALTAATMTLC